MKTFLKWCLALALLVVLVPLGVVFGFGSLIVALVMVLLGCVAVYAVWQVFYVQGKRYSYLLGSLFDPFLSPWGLVRLLFGTTGVIVIFLLAAHFVLPKDWKHSVLLGFNNTIDYTAEKVKRFKPVYVTNYVQSTTQWMTNTTEIVQVKEVPQKPTDFLGIVYAVVIGVVTGIVAFLGLAWLAVRQEEKDMSRSPYLHKV